RSDAPSSELPLRCDYGVVHGAELRAETSLAGDVVVEHSRDVSARRPAHDGGEGGRSQGRGAVSCATRRGERIRRPVRAPQCDLGSSRIAVGNVATCFSPSGDGFEIPALVWLGPSPDDGRGRFPAFDLCRRRVRGGAPGGGPSLHARRVLHSGTLV